MKKIVTLSKEYVRVMRKESNIISYGGDQNLFASPKADSEDIRKQKYGCGIVAFADLLLYLGTVGREYIVQESECYVNRILSEEEYKCYYNDIYAFMGGIKGNRGISGLKLWRKFNRLSKREKWHLRARWGMSGRKLHGRIEEMLGQDIPVICCIPMMLLKKDKEDYLSLYRWQRNAEHPDKLIKATNAREHYVMITGINVIDEELFYEVSSWGKKFYINCKEYDDFMRKHFLGILLGNILYIQSH